MCAVGAVRWLKSRGQIEAAEAFKDEGIVGADLVAMAAV